VSYPHRPNRPHCRTCRCHETVGEDRTFKVDPSAPFFDLVVEVDRLTLGEQRQAYRDAVADHHPPGEEPS
jgi:hypothetical protein